MKSPWVHTVISCYPSISDVARTQNNNKQTKTREVLIWLLVCTPRCILTKTNSRIPLTFLGHLVPVLYPLSKRRRLPVRKCRALSIAMRQTTFYRQQTTMSILHFLCWFYLFPVGAFGGVLAVSDGGSFFCPRIRCATITGSLLLYSALSSAVTSQPNRRALLLSTWRISSRKIYYSDVGSTPPPHFYRER